MRPLWARFLERFLDGPSVSGQVLDASGNPVSAEVIIKQTEPKEGERWTSRPRDGHFDRFLPETDRYHLEVKAADGARRLVELAPAKGRKELIIKLPAGQVQSP